jgi:hypothetical protein
MAVLARTDPARYAVVNAKIEAVRQLHDESQRAQRAQQEQYERQYQQRWKEFAAREDAEFDRKAGPELSTPEAKAKLGNAAIATLRNAGFSDDDLRRAYHGEASLSLRDHRAQLILMKAAKYDEAIANAAQARDRTAPPVQKPGIASGAWDDSNSELSALGRKLSASGDIKDAVRLLTAQRRANNRS